MKGMYGLVATIGLWPWAGAASAADLAAASDEEQNNTLTEIVVIAHRSAIAEFVSESECGGGPHR
jgi:hypothetical protein